MMSADYLTQKVGRRIRSTLLCLALKLALCGSHDAFFWSISALRRRSTLIIQSTKRRTVNDVEFQAGGDTAPLPVVGAGYADTFVPFFEMGGTLPERSPAVMLPSPRTAMFAPSQPPADPLPPPVSTRPLVVSSQRLLPSFATLVATLNMESNHDDVPVESARADSSADTRGPVRISDAEHHSSDPPESVAPTLLVRRRLRAQVPRLVTTTPTLLDGLQLVPKQGLIEALEASMRLADGTWVAVMRKTRPLWLSAVGATGMGEWRSASVKRTGSHGVASWWRSRSSTWAVLYRDGPLFASWFDHHRERFTDADWNKLMHILNGNGTRVGGYYHLLTGLTSEDAEAAAEEYAARDDVCGAEGTSDDGGSDVDEVTIVDEESHELLKVYGVPYVKAFKAFNHCPGPRVAKNWNDIHALIDGCKAEGELCRGPRFNTTLQMGKDKQGKATKGTKRTGKRSDAMRARDAARQLEWLGRLDTAVAEAWIRANRPDPSRVPEGSRYMNAYRSRETRAQYYGEQDHEACALIGAVDVWLNDAARGDTISYLGPMSRALIQSLLAIGNIERNPGMVVPGLAADNYGFNGDGLECVARAAANFLLTIGVPNDLIRLTGLDVADNDLSLLARPHVVQPGQFVVVADTASLCHIGGDWIVTINWPSATGPAYGGTYQHLYTPAGWTVEYVGHDGVVSVFPDLHGLAAQCQLVGRLSVRDAGGAVDIKQPSLLVYRNVPPAVPANFVDKRVTVTIGGVTAHYFRGCNDVALVCPGIYNKSAVIPTPVWAECEKLFASGISRQTAVNNASQVLRSSERVDGAMIGVIVLVLGEAMLTSAMVSVSVAGQHREAALVRARQGRGLPGLMETSFWPQGGTPDYGAMVRGDNAAPWAAVWALRGTAMVAAVAGVWLGGRFCRDATMPLVSKLLEQLKSSVPGSAPLRGWTYEQYTDGGYALSDEFMNGCVADVTPAPTWRWNGWWAGSIGVWLGRRDGVVTDVHYFWSLMHIRIREFIDAGMYYTTTIRDQLFSAGQIRFNKDTLLPWLGFHVIAVPLFEEWGKRRSRLIYHALPLVEAAAMVSNGFGVVPALVNRYVLHGGCAWLPYWAGVVAHIGWNAAVVANMGEMGLSGRRLVLMATPLVVAGGLGAEYVIEKGKVWWKTSPMGTGSTFDLLIGTRHVAQTDPLLKILVSSRRLMYGKVSTNAVYQLFPSILPMASFANDRGNYCHSMHGRVGRVTPLIVDDVGFEQVGDVLKKLAYSVRGRVGIVEPVDFDEFVSKFPPGKRRAYIEAREVFDAVGTTPIMKPHLFKDYKADVCAAFLKHELNVERPDITRVFDGVQHQYAPADPRTICPRWLPLQSQMIPYILAFDKHIKLELVERSASLFGVNVRFASGLNVEDMSAMCASLMAENGLDCIIDNGDDGMFTVNGVAYYVDGERWDAHFRREYHHLIIDCYSVMGLPSNLANAMHKLVYRKLSWGRGVRCEIDRNNASGESDTTLRNGLCNFVIKLVAIRRSGRLVGPKAAIFVAAARKLGFVYEVAADQSVVFDPYGDFCARVWLGRQMVLKPGRIFSKAMWAANKSIPLAELQVAKLDALARDFDAFPEVAAELRGLLCELGTPTERARAAVAKERYNQPGSMCTTTVEERERFFGLRYRCDYQAFIADVAHWVNAVRDGVWEVDLPVLRQVAERDMGVSSLESVAQREGLKLIPHSSFASLTSAETRRREAAARGRSSWLATTWNKVMHALNGNGGWLRVILWLVLCWAVTSDVASVGWVGGGNLIPEQTLGYQRHWYFMPKKNNSNNKSTSAMQKVLNAVNKTQRSKGGGKTQKKRSSAGARAADLRGDGLYKIIGPLARMAVKAALPGALQSASSRLMPSASRIQGSGDYVCNDIVHMGGGHPVKGLNGVPTTKYTHSEFIQDILVPTAPAAFTSTKLSLNAADGTTFPWLARLASLYTKFKFTKLVFEFRTTTSNYSAAGTLGTVIMAPHYNVDSAQYPTKQVMEAATHAVSAAPSNSVMLGFECAKKDNNVSWYNVINDSTIARSNFTDPGYVEIATSGLPGTAGTTLGELWVHYSCELIEPYISQAEQLSTGVAMPITRYESVSQNLSNPFTNGVFGFQYTAMVAVNDGSIPSSVYQASVKAVAEPTSGAWFTWCGGDSTKRLGFKYAGTYTLTYRARLTSATTASTSAPFLVIPATGTVNIVNGNNPTPNFMTWGATSSWVAYTWTVQVSSGATLTTEQGTGWTGVTAIQASELVIYKIG